MVAKTAGQFHSDSTPLQRLWNYSVTLMSVADNIMQVSIIDFSCNVQNDCMSINGMDIF